MEPEDVGELLAVLRSERGDSAAVEAKRARSGWPVSVGPTLAAFANTPGGGLLILGVDEVDNFSVSGVYDAGKCREALGSFTRQALEPPIRHSSEVVELEGTEIVVARIAEADASETGVPQLVGMQNPKRASIDRRFQRFGRCQPCAHARGSHVGSCVCGLKAGEGAPGRRVRRGTRMPTGHLNFYGSDRTDRPQPFRLR